MVSERQAGFESKTDAVGSEGTEEILAIVVLSMEMLMPGCTARIVLRLVCGLRIGNAPMVVVRLLSHRPSSQVSASMDRPKVGVCCKTRKPSESSSRECSCKVVRRPLYRTDADKFLGNA